MWLFLASDCLFFGSFIAAYLLYRDRSLTGPYPEDLFDIPFTSVSAFVLLMSSVSMVLALAAIQKGNVRGMQVWLLTTAILGTLFVAGQAYEFTEFHHEGLSLSTNLFGTTFFVLTGFHGAHVTVGVLILMSLFVYSLRGGIQQKDSLNIELAGLYWHFVDIVWIVIFTLIYLVQP
jgi:heme/copper-type cytochrome/quinol oxidase subunit 3